MVNFKHLINSGKWFRKIKIKSFPYKTLFFVPLLVGAVSLSTVMVRSSFQDLEVVFLLQEGLNTCFKRVSQSFIAGQIGNRNSKYLSPDFIRMTQECFGDMLGTLDGKNEENFKNIKSKVNLLATDVYWFYEEYKRGQLKPSPQKNKVVIIQRYNHLESTKETIFEEMEGVLQGLDGRMEYLLFAVFIGSIFLFGVFGYQFVTGRALKRRNFLSEKEALVQLEGKGALLSMSIEDLIKRTLEQNHLPHCSRLFSKYHMNLLDEKLLTFPSPEQMPAAGKNYTYVDESFQLKKVEGKGDREKAASVGQTINMGSVLSKVVGIFAEKFFTHGIILDIDVDDNLNVLATDEALQQVLFNLINNSIQSLSQESKHKRITIKSRVIGGTAILQILDTGKGLSPRILKDKNIFEKEVINAGRGLKICREFMEKFEGKITFNNHYDKNGGVSGAKVNLLFKMVKEAQEPGKEKEKEKSAASTRKDQLSLGL